MSRERRRKPSHVATIVQEQRALESQKISEAAVDPVDAEPPANTTHGSERERRKSLGVQMLTGEALESDLSSESRIYLEDQVTELRERADSEEMVMPISKIKVRTRVMEVDAGDVVVSEVNKRIQEFLTDEAVSDILEDIERKGQLEPALGRPRKDGKVELIAGSRRLYVASRLGRKLIMRIGDFPDGDIEDLSDVENRAKPLSPYERAIMYQRWIETKRYSTWEMVAAAEKLSKSAISNYKALVELPKSIVGCFSDPSALTTKLGLKIRADMNRSSEHQKAILDEAAKIRKEVEAGKELAAEVVTKRFKSAVSVVQEGGYTAPSARKPSVYKAGKAGLIKHSIHRDGKRHKIELEGMSDDQVHAVIEAAIKAVGAKLEP